MRATYMYVPVLRLHEEHAHKLEYNCLIYYSWGVWPRVGGTLSRNLIQIGTRASCLSCSYSDHWAMAPHNLTILCRYKCCTCKHDCVCRILEFIDWPITTSAHKSHTLVHANYTLSRNHKKCTYKYIKQITESTYIYECVAIAIKVEVAGYNIISSVSADLDQAKFEENPLKYWWVITYQSETILHIPILQHSLYYTLQINTSLMAYNSEKLQWILFKFCM